MLIPTAQITCLPSSTLVVQINFLLPRTLVAQPTFRQILLLSPIFSVLTTEPTSAMVLSPIFLTTMTVTSIFLTR